MTNEFEQFHTRLNRIQRSRSRQRGVGFVVHPDGVVTAIGRPSTRLHFGFPLKGLVLSLMVAVAVKAYLMWFLGSDIYTLEVENLLAGSNFDRIAGLILMPDALTSWMSERYQDIHVIVRSGIGARI